MKRLLAVLVSIALAAGLMSPALAAEEPHPRAPILLKTLETPLKVRSGDTLHFEMEAALPEGDDGVLSYAWYDYTWRYNAGLREPLGTGPTLDYVAVSPGILTEITGSNSRTICVVATNTYVDENGDTQTASTSEQVIFYPGTFIIDMAESPWAHAIYGVICLPLALIATPLAVVALPFSFLLGPMGPALIGPLFAPIAGVVAAVKFFLA